VFVLHFSVAELIAFEKRTFEIAFFSPTDFFSHIVNWFELSCLENATEEVGLVTSFFILHQQKKR
jgi:hypothetical protein